MTAAKTIRVYPNLDRPAGDHLPGLGEDGLELPVKEARALIDSGWAVTTEPVDETADEPATPAEGE